MPSAARTAHSCDLFWIAWDMPEAKVRRGRAKRQPGVGFLGFTVP